MSFKISMLHTLFYYTFHINMIICFVSACFRKYINVKNLISLSTKLLSSIFCNPGIPDTFSSLNKFKNTTSRNNLGPEVKYSIFQNSCETPFSFSRACKQKKKLFEVKRYHVTPGEKVIAEKAMSRKNGDVAARWMLTVTIKRYQRLIHLFSHSLYLALSLFFLNKNRLHSTFLTLMYFLKE